MLSALSRDTMPGLRSSAPTAYLTGAFAPAARMPPLAWFIVTSIFASPRASRDHAVSARSPQAAEHRRPHSTRILSDNHLTPMTALSGASPLALARFGVGTAPVARYHHSSAVYSYRSPVGYFDQFPPTSLSVGCRFGQRTFAGAPVMERMRRFRTLPASLLNGEVRSLAVIRTAILHRLTRCIPDDGPRCEIINCVP
jgi:hypothetical protein